ncbi:hypothetical protein, partial [Dactylosporangium sp. NPDC005555]|uniref:hypothetical protein n=1 Tax=Dactylosporangium sp. NPDC005555 TaxID=3154889 RepID=UPI0033A649A8
QREPVRLHRLHHHTPAPTDTANSMDRGYDTFPATHTHEHAQQRSTALKSTQPPAVGSPYFVGAGGYCGQDDEPDIIDYASPPPGQPNPWCKWLPTAAGDAIEFDEDQEKFYDSERWMLYLVDTFLRPGATLQAELRVPVAGRVYADEFAAFTFDHDVDGVLLAQGDYEEDVWRLIVRHNTVLFQDGTFHEKGPVTWDTPEVPLTLATGRPTR